MDCLPTSANRRAVRAITDFVFLCDAPQKSDIILIPGTSQSAVTEQAAALYRAGYAAHVLPSGQYSSALGHFATNRIDNPRYAGSYNTDFAYCQRILIDNGVPAGAILCEDRATNTLENALFSAQVIKRAGIQVRRAILCCQAFHARRAFLSYACYFTGVELLVVPTVTQGISANTWFKSDEGYCKVMGEVAKCGAYFKNHKELLCR